MQQKKYIQYSIEKYNLKMTVFNDKKNQIVLTCSDTGLL